MTEDLFGKTQRLMEQIFDDSNLIATIPPGLDDDSSAIRVERTEMGLAIAQHLSANADSPGGDVVVATPHQVENLVKVLQGWLRERH